MGELKFLENYSMISTYALHVGFLSSLTIVNEGVVKTIVNEGSSSTIVIKTTIFIKTIVLKNDHFKKTTLKKTNVFENDRFVFDFSSSFS